MRPDHELVAGIASRDPEAFRELMERYGSGLINLAYRFLGTQADAEDVAQEVFFRLYRHPPRLDPSTKLSTWLYRVTVNLCLDLLRKKPSAFQTVSLEASPQTGSPSDEAEALPLFERIPAPSGATPRDRVAQAEIHTLIRKRVAELPSPLRTPLILSLFEELSHQEIAKVLHLSPKAVERRIARARQILKSRLSPYL